MLFVSGNDKIIRRGTVSSQVTDVGRGLSVIGVTVNLLMGDRGIHCTP
jgi:hypothetical protein